LIYQRNWIREILISSSIPPTSLLAGLPESSGRRVRSYPQPASSSPRLARSHSLGGWTIGQWWPRFWDISLTPHNQLIKKWGACLPLRTCFAGSNLVEGNRFFKDDQNPQLAFLQRRIKAVGLLS
jgi:hypothetical protein